MNIKNKQRAKLALAELEKEMEILSKEEANACKGGGSGTQSDPYSWNEYEALLDSPSFNGGWVRDVDGSIFYGLSSVTVGGTGYNIDNAVSHLNLNAQSKSVGRCAKYVRQAIEAGGLSTNGRPNSAKDYDDYLPSIGFQEIDKDGYMPQKGDIVVLESVPGHSHGHIAMYNGEKWVSDFEQTDMWGGAAYRNKAEYSFFRYGR